VGRFVFWFCWQKIFRSVVFRVEGFGDASGDRGWDPGPVCGRGTYLGAHEGHESGADLPGLLLTDVDLLDVELVRLGMLVRLEHLAHANVDELDGRGAVLGGLVGHGAGLHERGAAGDAGGRAEGRRGGDGVHGTEGESHRGSYCNREWIGYDG
jgi:hypothetical protein